MNGRVICASLIVATMLSACGGSDGPSSPQVRVPNYAGNWSGTYTITGCNQSGQIAFANICGNLGATPSYSFSLTQSDRNVAGAFSLGSVTFPNTGGTIAQDGSLALSGTSVSNGITVVVNWALNLPAQALTGTITQQWSSTGLTGSATVTGNVNTAIRSASAAASASASTFLRPSDLAAAMSGR